MRGVVSPPLRIAGYQGAQSILTRSMRDLADRLSVHDADWCIQTEDDITASGESAATLFRSVDGGERQVCYMASGYLAARVPALAALDLPFSVTDRQAALRALDGAAGAFLTSAVQEHTGYKVLGFWDNGFRHITNGVRAIRCVRDCEGLSVRTLDSAVYRDALAAMGFRPRTTDVKELLRVVRMREVEAQENPLTNFVNFELWRHHPYVSLTGHFFGVLILVCNRVWFAGLSAARQEALIDAARHSTRLQRELAAREDAALTQYLASQGIQVLEQRDLDLASMRQATRPIVERERKRLAPQLVHAYLDQVGGNDA